MADAANDVFVSYKAEDRKRLIPLVEALEAEGFNVWWDQHIDGGANWRDEIESHLDAAKVVVVVWSRRTIGPEGRFVRDEAGQAQEAGHYLPITIDKVRPPLGFREVQALDLSTWKGNRGDVRFKALAETIRNRLAGKDIDLVIPKGPVVSRRNAIAGGASVAVLAGGGGFFLLKPAPSNAKRIAVLPFANLSSGSDDYFAAGLAEELRGALSRAGLLVIGRNSSEAVAKADSTSIARKLDVAHILTGSVRKSSATLRVSAQLVNARDGTESWNRNYDRAPGDVIRIQSDIAEQVAESLSVATGVIRAAVKLGGTKDPVAQTYIQQLDEALEREGTTKDTLTNAITLARRAIARDPKFARAWLILGESEVFYATTSASGPDEAARLIAEGERDIRRGIALAPQYAGGYASLSSIAGSRNEFQAALRYAREALKRLPNGEGALVNAVNYLPYIGTRQEAEVAARRLISLDPLSAFAHTGLGEVFRVSGRTDDAMVAYRRALELEPKNVQVLFVLGLAQIEKGNFAEGLKLANTIAPGNLHGPQIRGLVAARRGERSEVEKQISIIRGLYGDYASYQYAQVYAHGGEVERAFAALATAERAKDPGLYETMRDPFLKPLRKDPRFLALLKRLKFPIIDPGIGKA